MLNHLLSDRNARGPEWCHTSHEVRALTPPRRGFEHGSIEGAQPRAGREKEGIVPSGFGMVSVGEPVVQAPAEGLTKTRLIRTHWTRYEKLVSMGPLKSEGWVSCQ